MLAAAPMMASKLSAFQLIELLAPAWLAIVINWPSVADVSTSGSLSPIASNPSCA